MKNNHDITHQKRIPQTWTEFNWQNNVELIGFWDIFCETSVIQHQMGNDTCNLEITSGIYRQVLTLNGEEVKQLLDLMNEAYATLGKRKEK